MEKTDALSTISPVFICVWPSDSAWLSPGHIYYFGKGTSHYPHPHELILTNQMKSLYNLRERESRVSVGEGVGVWLI